MRLLTNSGNATGADIPIRQWGNRELSHLYTLFVWGTFDGSTTTLEISPDGIQWFSVTGVSITSKTAINVEFRASHVRAVTAGGAGATSVNALIN